MSSKTKGRCKDCVEEWGGFPPPASLKRPTPYPGPRCATHHRERKKLLKEQAHARHIEGTYGITLEQYRTLLEKQGGVCFICRRANGSSRKLAVDHSHSTGFVRGLLCSTCNKLLGHLRDEPEAGNRIRFYLNHPPAFRYIGKVRPSGADENHAISDGGEVKPSEG